MRSVSWVTLKNFAISRNLPIQYLDHGQTYEVIIVDG